VKKLDMKMVIDPNAKPMTPDLLIRILFGKSMKEFVQEIRENKDGKYDNLFVKDEAEC